MNVGMGNCFPLTGLSGSLAGLSIDYEQAKLHQRVFIQIPQEQVNIIFLIFVFVVVGLLLILIHKWVNAESMLEKCYVGKLMTDLPTRKGSGVSRSSKSSKGSTSSNSLTPSGIISKAPPTFSQATSPQIPVYDWFQNSRAVTLSVYTRWKNIQPEHITVDKADRDLLLTVVIDMFIYTVHLVHTESGKVEVTLPKCKPEYTWKTLGKSLPGDKSFLKASETETVFREGEVVSVRQVTHDTKLLCIAPPHGSRVCVPIGHHIHIKHTVQDMEITRSYTSVLPSLIQNNQDPRIDQGTAVYLLIKIYPNGALTPWIDTLQPGNKIHFSGSTGTFDLSQLAGVTHLFLFAAGTGFTPMMRIIYHTVVTSEESSKMQVHLMFYNKKEQDIFWRHELDILASTSSRWFQVTYVLSEATENWTGLRGQICMAHLADKIPVIEDSIKPLVCACGPRPFTELVMRLAKSHGLQDTNLHAFLG
ncbi:hypothetical protein C0Q70_11654 [Pomacea canaliculata]|uniref:FAD-binding FR-type domain-containing protein n=1 Tax=Pomacea canaliculata TaxID=400727 RepID=A0A2T7P6K6_POMCA|nr:hypothetical protein C0Q70_11654 [Pomacea canaliculata]